MRGGVYLINWQLSISLLNIYMCSLTAYCQSREHSCLKYGGWLPLLHTDANNSLVFCKVLLQLDDRKAESVGLVLAALQKQLTRLPVPYTHRQAEADEHGLCRCCNALAAFTKPFVEEVKRKNGSYVATSENEELRIELLKL